MGFFNRIATSIKSNINAMISKSEDPEKMLEQITTEMNQQLIEAKKRVAASIVDERRMERQYKTQDAEIHKWETRALSALEESEINPQEREKYENLAKEALLRKRDLETSLVDFKAQYEIQKKNSEVLKQSLKELSDKIEEAKRKKNSLIARKRRAEIQQSFQNNVNSSYDNNKENLFSAFDRMEKKVEQMEIEAGYSEGTEELTDNTEKEFMALENNTTSRDLDEALDELKQLKNNRITQNKETKIEVNINKNDRMNDPELEDMMNQLKNRFKKD